MSALETISPVSPSDGPQPNGSGFNPGLGGQAFGVHGVVAAAGGVGAVRMDVSMYVTASSLLHTSFCHFFGLLTPTN
jgi:hypothetical protein